MCKFTVMLESTVYVSVCIQDVAAYDIVYVYSFLVCSVLVCVYTHTHRYNILIIKIEDLNHSCCTAGLNILYNAFKCIHSRGAARMF